MIHKVAVIIVAGGSGARMGADVPKQFLEVAGEAILIHTLRRFAEAMPEAQLIVVLPEGEIPRWRELSRNCGVAHEVCGGGASRAQSVSNGLRVVKDADFVGVHDGVRPFVSRELLERAMKCVVENGSAVPVIPVVDSFRIIDNIESVTPKIKSRPFDRAMLRIVQTPQFFKTDTLQKAYLSANIEKYTDDASLVEALGVGVRLYDGDDRNIKITTPKDLVFAELLLKEFL